MYIRPGQVKTSYFYQKKNFETYQIETVDYYDEVNTKNERFASYVRLDMLKITIKRNEYDFLVWLAMLGGIQKLIKAYFSKATYQIANQVFKNSLLSDLFFVKHRNDDAKRGHVDVEGKRVEANELDVSD